MVKKTRKSEELVEEYFCDMCGKKCHSWCSACTREICSEHLTFDYSKSDDYPEKYCKECLEIKKPFFEELGKLKIEEEKIYYRQEELREEWFKLCREKNVEVAKNEPSEQDKNDDSIPEQRDIENEIKKEIDKDYER